MPDTENPYASTGHMLEVHTMFRREFGLLPALVRSVPEKDDERAKVVAAHTRLVNQALHQHDAGEDAVLWPLLLARGPSEIEPIVNLVEGHHREIENIFACIDVLLDTWTDGALRWDGEVIAWVLERLATALYEHMNLEEKLLLPLVERHIFAVEWEKMVEDQAAGVPQELGPVIAGMLMYEGGVDVLSPPIRELLGDLAPQAYAEYCERVHGRRFPLRSTEVVNYLPCLGGVHRVGFPRKKWSRNSPETRVP